MVAANPLLNIIESHGSGINAKRTSPSTPWGRVGESEARGRGSKIAVKNNIPSPWGEGVYGAAVIFCCIL
jgi:hypothetical protein